MIDVIDIIICNKVYFFKEMNAALHFLHSYVVHLKDNVINVEEAFTFCAQLSCDLANISI